MINSKKKNTRTGTAIPERSSMESNPCPRGLMRYSTISGQLMTSERAVPEVGQRGSDSFSISLDVRPIVMLLEDSTCRY
jgi:hypothetical protein